MKRGIFSRVGRIVCKEYGGEDIGSQFWNGSWQPCPYFGSGQTNMLSLGHFPNLASFFLLTTALHTAEPELHPGAECYFCCSCSVKLDCSHFNTSFPSVLCSRSWIAELPFPDVHFGLLTKALFFPDSLKELKLVCTGDIFEALIQIFSLY